MTNPGPNEVLELFSGDLSQALDEAAKTEGVRGEAEHAAAQASNFLGGAESAAKTATSELHSLRMTAISAIEAAGEDVDGRDVVEATMAARGQSGQEIEDYFSHVERIEAEEQPVIVICTAEHEMGVYGLAKVIYGMTPGQSGSAWSDRNNKMRFDKNGKLPSMRDVVIPIVSKRGYRLVAPDRPAYNADISVFANMPDDETADPIVVNEEHGFERVHFAGSPEEVRDTADLIVAKNMRSIADHNAVHSVGLPTMVAYGENAVLELSALISEQQDSRLRVLNRRCLEGLVDLTGIMPGLDELELPAAQKESYHIELGKALFGFLRDGQSLITEGSNDEKLAFWAPLQAALDYYPELVLEDIQGMTRAIYSPHEDRVVAIRDGFEAVQVTQNLLAEARRVQDFGVQVRTSRPMVNGRAHALEEKALRNALDETPLRNLGTRRKIKKHLRDL